MVHKFLTMTFTWLLLKAIGFLCTAIMDGDSLPSWWTNKVAVAVDKLDGMADYIDTQVESVQEATDLYNKGGIQIVRVSMARGKVGVEMTVGNKQIELSDVQFKNLQRALPKINLRQGLGEATPKPTPSRRNKQMPKMVPGSVDAAADNNQRLCLRHLQQQAKRQDCGFHGVQPERYS